MLNHDHHPEFKKDGQPDPAQDVENDKKLKQWIEEEIGVNATPAQKSWMRQGCLMLEVKANRDRMGLILQGIDPLMEEFKDDEEVMKAWKR